MHNLAKMVRGGCAFVLGILTVALSGPLSAQEYSLVKGDMIQIAFGGGRDPVEMMIDVEGGVRLLDVGRVKLAGQDLDTAEELVEQAIAKVGLFVDPQVLISVVDYAPIVVAGDVATPGKFTYLPGMTVSTALGLSGGTLVSGFDQFEVERARTEVEGQIRLLNLEIAGTIVEIAKLQAARAGDGVELTLDAELRRMIPAPNAIDLPRMVRDAVASLEAERQLLASSEALWASELETLEEQQRLFERRVAVQREIVETAQSSLANAQSLQERGLQTAARLSTVQQREADARARLLELESAQIAATRAIGESRRALLRFTANVTGGWLDDLRAAKLALDEDQVRYARAQQQLGLLMGDTMDALFASAGATSHFTVSSARDGRTHIEGLRPDSPLLPGDTLIVQVTTDLQPPLD